MSGRIDLMAPEVRAHPYPLYAELRQRAPVCQVDPGGFWAITRHDDVVAAFRNPQLFSSTGVRVTTRPAWLGHNPFSDSMIAMDPPDHGRLRVLVSRAFGPASIQRLESRLREFARGLAARIQPERVTDFVEAFATPLPASVIGELFGLEPSLTERYKRWAVDLTRVSATTERDLHQHGPIRDTVREMEQSFAEVVAARRRAPREDLVTDLLNARVEGEALSDAELMSFLFLLVVAGLETTAHLLSHCMRMLLAFPHLALHLRENRAQVPRFVEEVLRYEPPVHGIVRITTAEAEVSGVKIPAGARVLLLLGSACRDSSHVPGADTFTMERDGMSNLPFGHGIHFCLGAQLSRLEARVGVEVLLARFGGFTSAGPEAWNTSLTVRGPLSLPVVGHLP